MALSDAQIAQTAEPLVKKIPVLGQVYSASEGLGVILAKALPNVFDTKAGISAKSAALFDQKVYNAKKDAFYFAMMFDDSNFTIPTVVLNGVHPMLVLTEDQYNQGVNNGDFVNGTSVRPTGNPGKYLLFPNIVKAYVEEQIRLNNEEQQQQQQIAQEKSTYGPFYSIINWFRTTTIGDDFKAGAAQIGESIKTTTGIQTTWELWVIGGLTVAGALAITYVILED